MPRRNRKPVGLARFGGVTRWSPPGRLARKIPPKPTRERPVCPFCFSAHAIGRTGLQAMGGPWFPGGR